MILVVISVMRGQKCTQEKNLILVVNSAMKRREVKRKVQPGVLGQSIMRRREEEKQQEEKCIQVKYDLFLFTINWFGPAWDTKPYPSL